MRVVLDACVLYPPILREILLGAASAGLYTPLWSARILEEWARATVKLGPAAEAQARTEVALTRAAFPKASLAPAPGIERRLQLPDDNDTHVLAVAIAGSADAILTYNAADFPRHVLAAEGLARRDPDGFLWELWSRHPDAMAQVLETVRAKAEALAGQPQGLPALLRRVRLNRLAKAVQVG
ncbi:MAG: PIN domain-containing protein [Pseudorhodobacter sp.]|nr:PIN domain-containing protein [Pseudorhodobacter sp.]